MNTHDIANTLAGLFAEITTGAPKDGAFIVNPNDPGMIGSLEKLSAADASRSMNDGATIAAHAAHVSYGLSLMNRWAKEGGNPFADAKWNEAWKITSVEEDRWKQIRADLDKEIMYWQEALKIPREVMPIEMSGMIGSIAHTAYHLGAIRQIHPLTRGPKEGTF